MIGFACDLASRNTRFPGVIVTQLRQSIGSAIDDLESILSTMSEDALRGLVILYLPYRGIGLSG